MNYTQSAFVEWLIFACYFHGMVKCLRRPINYFRIYIYIYSIKMDGWPAKMFTFLKMHIFNTLGKLSTSNIFVKFQSNILNACDNAFHSRRCIVWPKIDEIYYMHNLYTYDMPTAHTVHGHLFSDDHNEQMEFAFLFDGVLIQMRMCVYVFFFWHQPNNITN